MLMVSARHLLPAKRRQPPFSSPLFFEVHLEGRIIVCLLKKILGYCTWMEDPGRRLTLHGQQLFLCLVREGKCSSVFCSPLLAFFLTRIRWWSTLGVCAILQSSSSGALISSSAMSLCFGHCTWSNTSMIAGEKHPHFISLLETISPRVAQRAKLRKSGAYEIDMNPALGRKWKNILAIEWHQ